MPHDPHDPHDHAGHAGHAHDHRQHGAPHHGHDHRHSQDHRGHDHGHAHHGHSHDHGSGSEGRLRLALILTAGFMLAEVIGGLVSGSLALIADAGHMLTDAASLALALLALRISRRPVDDQRSYGYGRMQVLAAFVNGLSLLAITAWIAVEAVIRLFEPVEVMAKPMLVIAALGLLVNIAAFLILHRGGDENLNVQGALAHVLGDLLGSVAAIAAALIIMGTGWMPADPLLSLAVAALILRTGLRITREAGHILLQGAPEPMDLPQLEQGLLAAVPGLEGIHHVHLWSLTPQERIMTLHAVLRSGADSDSVTAGVTAFLRQTKGIGHVTVQVEHQPCAEREHRHRG